MRDRVDTFWKTIKQRGHERITFMIIPHGESHIISLQLSKFAIFFATLTLFMVMGASILSTELQESMQSEVTELHDTNRTFFYKREQYYQKLDSLIAYHNDLKSRLAYLSEKAGLSGADSPFEMSDIYLLKVAEDQMSEEAEAFKERMSRLVAMKESEVIKSDVNYPLLDEFEQLPDHDKFAYSSLVVAYRKLYHDLNQTVRLLNVLESFLNEREDVQKSLPYYWPIAGGHFTSFYGPRFSPFGRGQPSEFHLGIDLADTIGTPIYAAAEGKVVRSGYSGGYGNRVMIQHRFGYATVYAHMSSILVHPGQYVRKGQIIGRVGATGRATGPHLHFEVRVNGKHVDPLPYVSSR